MTSQLVYINDCASTNVTTSAYLQIVASTPVGAQSIQFLYIDSAGAFHLIKLATGAVGFEVDICVNSNIDGVVYNYPIAAGTRLSVKSADTIVNTGNLALALFPSPLVPFPSF